MEIINPTKKIYFLADTSEIISAILNKYQLEESDEEMGKKFFSDEDIKIILPGEVILKISLSLIKKEITEKEAAVRIQKELNIAQPLSETLVNEIKTQIIPLATNINPNPPTTPRSPNENLDVFPKIKSPIGVEEALNKNPVPPEKGLGSKVIETKKIEKAKKNDISEITEKPILKPNQPKGPDSYREPIE